MLSDIFSNHLLMNALLAWATAQLLKFWTAECPAVTLPP